MSEQVSTEYDGYLEQLKQELVRASQQYWRKYQRTYKKNSKGVKSNNKSISNDINSANNTNSANSTNNTNTPNTPPTLQLLNSYTLQYLNSHSDMNGHTLRRLLQSINNGVRNIGVMGNKIDIEEQQGHNINPSLLIQYDNQLALKLIFGVNIIRNIIRNNHQQMAIGDNLLYQWVCAVLCALYQGQAINQTAIDRLQMIYHQNTKDQNANTNNMNPNTNNKQKQKQKYIISYLYGRLCLCLSLHHIIYHINPKSKLFFPQLCCLITHLVREEKYLESQASSGQSPHDHLKCTEHYDTSIIFECAFNYSGVITALSKPIVFSAIKRTAFRIINRDCQANRVSLENIFGQQFINLHSIDEFISQSVNSNDKTTDVATVTHLDSLPYDGPIRTLELTPRFSEDDPSFQIKKLKQKKLKLKKKLENQLRSQVQVRLQQKEAIFQVKNQRAKQRLKKEMFIMQKQTEQAKAHQRMLRKEEKGDKRKKGDKGDKGDKGGKSDKNNQSNKNSHFSASGKQNAKPYPKTKKISK